MIATVYAVFASPEEAERIGREMVEQGLAACVNILAPCRSIYRWQGRLEQAEEIPALFKVDAAKASALVDAIAAAHSYDVPAIAVWPVAYTPECYARWITGNTIPDGKTSLLLD